MAQVPFLVTTDLCFSVLASIYNQLEKEEAWKRGKGPKAKGRNAPARYFLFTLLLRFLTEGSTGGPLPPTTRPTSELFSYHLSSDKLLRAKPFSINGARVFFCLQLLARALSLSLSLSLVFPCLSYLTVCVSVPRECRCWTSSVLASVGPEGVFVRVRFFFFLPSGRGVGLLRAYSKQRQPGGCAD